MDGRGSRERRARGPPGSRSRLGRRLEDDRRTGGREEDTRRSKQDDGREDEAPFPGFYRRSRSPPTNRRTGHRRDEGRGSHFSEEQSYYPSSRVKGRSQSPTPTRREVRRDDRRDHRRTDEQQRGSKYSREPRPPFRDERGEHRVEGKIPRDRRDLRESVELPEKRRRLGADQRSHNGASSQPQRELPASLRDEAPRQQQIQWGKRLTNRDATVESILTLFSTDGHRFSPRNLATAAHRAAKNGKRDRRGLQQDPRMVALAEACVRRVNDFEPQHLANVVWAFATAGVEAPQLFTEVADVALSKLRDFNSQAIANTAWAYAKAGVEATRLFDEIAVVAVSKLRDFNSQDIANTLWAFATAGVEAPRLFAEIAEVAMSKLWDFNSQNVANTAWAFATAGVEAPQLFTEVADVAVSKLRDFNSQNIANTAWAYATAGVEAPRLFTQIADVALSKLRYFNSQAIANTAWAFATAGVEAPLFFAEIADVAVLKLHDFNSQSIANTAWAFATAGVEAPRLFAKMADVAVSKLRDFNPQNIANTVLATSRSKTPHRLKNITDTAVSQLRDFNAQNIANTAWAFACIGSTNLDFFTAILTEALAKQNSFDSFELSQLHLVDLHFQCAFPEQSFPLAPIRDRLHAAYQRNEPKPSQLQRDVAAVLNDIGWSHEFEYTTPEGLSLDMAQPDSKWAVEVNGPSHFLKSTTGTKPQENGPTRFKLRLLQQFGWTVIKVPYFEWDRLRSSMERETYLRGKLVEAP